MKMRFAIALLAIAILCPSAVAQENTTGYWLKKGYELSANGSNEQALQAYEKVVQIDPDNDSALEINPKDAPVWGLKVMC